MTRQIVPTRLFVFGSDDDQRWGVLVIPPTRNAPHVFVKDIHKRNRGDIYVRRGTTTDKALPSDYARFFAQHLDEHAYQQKVELRELRERVSSIEQRRSRRSRATTPGTPAPDPAVQTDEATHSLVDAITRHVGVQRDPISEGLMREARSIRAYITSAEIPWNLQVPSREDAAKLLETIEDRCREYWRAVALLRRHDDAAQYEEDLIASLALLAEETAPPPGHSYTDLGQYIRYYPLVFALYAAFVAGCISSRVTLLKKCAQLTLAGRSEYDDPEHIGFVFFYIHRAGGLFATQHPNYPNQTWCDPVATRIQAVIGSLVSDDDPRWKPERAFFAGEFLLCLVPLDMAPVEGQYTVGHPSSGSFMYHSVARVIIPRFLRDNVTWLEKVFTRNLSDMLADFDNTAAKVVSSRYWPDGFVRGAREAAYPTPPA